MPTEAVVHVIDDDMAVRKSLAFLLASEGFAVRLHESASAFLHTVADVQGAGPACIVSDVRMPGIDGVGFLRRLRSRGTSVPVIVITGHADVALAVSAMKEGAFDFIEKPFDDDVFLKAVHSALAQCKQQHRDADQILDVRRRFESLSERERQVVEGLVAGKANKVIARDLGISPRTVEIYRANVMTKTAADSLSGLVRMAILMRDAAP